MIFPASARSSIVGQTRELIFSPDPLPEGRNGGQAVKSPVGAWQLSALIEYNPTAGRTGSTKRGRTPG